MLRFSHYSVLSSPLSDGRFALLNTISGAIDIISTDIGDKLKGMLWNEKAEEASDIVNELYDETKKSFIERGHLTELSLEEEKQNVIQIAQALHEMESKQNIHFVIVPNYDCNYRCTYCFERPLQKKIDSKSKWNNSSNVLNEEQVDEIFYNIDNILDQSETSKKREITLYGGEPLDKQNKIIISKIIEEGIKRDFSYAAITNGHDIDQYIELLGNSKIKRIQITIDGPKRIHDKQRVYRGKASSFDKIMNNIRLVLSQTDAEVQIRVHLNSDGTHVFQEIIDIFDSEGWLNNEQVVIYTSVLYLKNKKGEVSKNTTNNNSIIASLKGISDSYFNVYVNAAFFYAMSAAQQAFIKGDRFHLKGIYCGANSGMYVFAPDNYVYACWESVGKACSRIGSYHKDKIEFDETMTKKWFNRSIATIPECQDCPYALACGGGCAQYAEYNEGTIYAPYCDDFQVNFRNALAESSELFLGEIDKNELQNSPILY